MEATIVDLRYHMNNVLKALERNENVTVLYRGKVKGVIRAEGRSVSSKVKVRDHAFFGSRASGQPVDQVMRHLRGGRYSDL
jgi:hypothetical protein